MNMQRLTWILIVVGLFLWCGRIFGEYTSAEYDYNFTTSDPDQQYRQVRLVRTGDSTVMWDSGSVSTSTPGSHTITVPATIGFGAGDHAYYIEQRGYLGPSFGNFWTGFGGVYSGTATEVESYHKYDAYFVVKNETDARATYTVRWWATADPDDVSKQHSSVFDLDVNAATDVHLSELYPFTYDVLRQDQGVEVDGETNIPPQVTDQGPEESTDTEVEEEPTEAEHEFTPIHPDNAPPEAAPDAERPEVVDSFETANEADEARATDARGDSDRVAKQVGKVGDAVSRLGELINGKGGDAVGGDTADKFSEAMDEAAEGHGDLQDGLGLVFDDLQEIAGKWNLSIGAPTAPVFLFPKPAQLGGGNVTLDMGDYASFCGLIRAGILLMCAWHFTLSIIACVKGVMS